MPAASPRPTSCSTPRTPGRSASRARPATDSPRGEPDLPAVDLARYDRLFEVPA